MEKYRDYTSSNPRVMNSWSSKKNCQKNTWQSCCIDEMIETLRRNILKNLEEIGDIKRENLFF